jgi:hypothetical protein
MTTPTSSSTRVIRLALLAVALVVGWLFILWQNRFYLTPAVVFVMLGYFAVVMTIYNLWRTGAAAVASNDEDDGDAAWGRPAGERDELEKEKRTLLKAIKEAEFDHAMGKLSQRDADEMIATYRARAIDVIKELERLDAGEAGTVRERIERELKARLELDGKADAKVKKVKKDKAAKEKVEKVENVVEKVAAKAEVEPEKSTPEADARIEAKDEAEKAEKAEAASTKAAVATAVEAADAEPRDAKEATP